MRTQCPILPWLPQAVAAALLVTSCGSAADSNTTPDPAGGQDDPANPAMVEDIRSTKARITSPTVAGSELEQLTGDNAAFALALYKQIIVESGNKNAFYSPHSISSALAMAYAGAEGTSESQMQSALQFRLAEADLHPTFNKLDLELQSRADAAGGSDDGSPFKLNIANALWGQRDYPFEQPFLDLLAQHYGAGLKGVDFRQQPEQARRAINAWVEEATENKIRDVLPRGAVDSLTRLVLTNAIYFKAGWAYGFEQSQTAPANFTTASGDTVQVEMMSLKESDGLAYATGDNWQAVELPYVGEKVSMVVIVPDAGVFDQVEDSLSATSLFALFDDLAPQAVELQLPRFGIESKFSLRAMLGALGMSAAFDPQEADFSGMSTAEQLFINDVIHQAFVSVDEEGTEAAAATAVTIGTTSISTPEYVNVTVDRPFIFVIRDRETNAVLFIGRVLDPS